MTYGEFFLEEAGDGVDAGDGVPRGSFGHVQVVDVVDFERRGRRHDGLATDPPEGRRRPSSHLEVRVVRVLGAEARQVAEGRSVAQVVAVVRRVRRQLQTQISRDCPQLRLCGSEPTEGADRPIGNYAGRFNIS